MAKILLESEVRTVGGLNKPYTNYLLCTKKRAEALNCNVTSPSNASDYQLIYEVSKAHNYALQGPPSITWTSEETMADIGIVSSKDGYWLAPSTQSSSSFISSVSISQTSGINGKVVIRFNTSQPQDGQITFVQTESGLTYTLRILKRQNNSLYVNITWMGSTMNFNGNYTVSVRVYLMNSTAAFNGTIAFDSGRPIHTLVSRAKATGNISNTYSTSIALTRVRVVITVANGSRYDRTANLSRQIFSNGSLYLSLYDNYINQTG